MKCAMIKLESSGILRRVAKLILTSVSEVRTKYLTTRCYIPEDSELHTRRRENLKSHRRNNSLCLTLTEGVCLITCYVSLQCAIFAIPNIIPLAVQD
jgi:hypothetical protein